MFKIAIIHPDTLAAIGLKQMLQEVMPMVSVDVFHSVSELNASDVDNYIHFFVATSVVATELSFFTERRRKTIVLSTSAESLSPFDGFHCLCTSVPEKQLIKSLLALEQMAHAAGRNLPAAATNHGNEKQLSTREAEVMSLIVKGMINKEIADRLNISLATVVTHRRNIMDKLRLKSVSALTIYAVTHGYVNINEI